MSVLEKKYTYTCMYVCMYVKCSCQVMSPYHLMYIPLSLYMTGHAKGVFVLCTYIVWFTQERQPWFECVLLHCKHNTVQKGKVTVRNAKQ